MCDTQNDRIQVFKKDGSFVKEKVIAPRHSAHGSVWDVAFSRDPKQRYLYVADGMNMKVHILDRESLDELTSFGDGGRQPGQFYAVHSIATDSKGNLYTVETYEGKRVQKFNYHGLRAVKSTSEGVLWPSAGSKPSDAAHEGRRRRAARRGDSPRSASDSARSTRRRARRRCNAPRFEVDPLWPKPLPNHWVLGNVIGVGVDANDHVFIVHRNDTFDARNEIGAAQKPPLSECCVPAPPVLEFDPAAIS